MSEEKKYNSIEDYVQSDEYKNLQVSILSKEKDFDDKIKAEELIPQFWWGNISNPSVVILGKNPSLKTDGDKNDLKDINNKIIKQYFKNNINRKGKFNSNFLYEEKIKDSYLVEWWNNFFNIKDLDKNKVGIFNLFGCYSRNSDFINDNVLNKSHIKRVEGKEEKIRGALRNSKAIIFLWYGSIKQWEKVLGEDFFNDDILNKIYIANYKNSFIPKLSEIVSYKDIEKIFEENHMEDIKNWFE